MFRLLEVVDRADIGVEADKSGSVECTREDEVVRVREEARTRVGVDM
jgi:hypothetical protein